MVSDLNEHRLLRTMQSLAANKTPCGIFFAPNMPANARQIVDSFKGNGINLNCICALSVEQKKFFQAAAGESLVAAEEFPALPDKPKYIFILNIFFPTFTARKILQLVHDAPARTLRRA